MTRDQIVAEIQAAAAANGGKPLGERTFVQATGITRSQLWRAGFPQYRAAVEAAGLVPNQLNAATDTSSMLEALAGLTRRLGRFPTKGDIKVARAKDPSFPSYEAYFRLSGQSFAVLPATLLDYCRRERSVRTSQPFSLRPACQPLVLQLLRDMCSVWLGTCTLPSTVATTRLVGPTMLLDAVGRSLSCFRMSLSMFTSSRPTILRASNCTGIGASSTGARAESGSTSPPMTSLRFVDADINRC